MPQSLRARWLSLATLAAFVFVQPAALCAALCLVERHHAAAHAMPGLGGRAHEAAVDGAACHRDIGNAVPHNQVQVLSPMAPAAAVVIAAAPERRVEPVWAVPSLPPHISRPADPPPPRAV